MEDTAPEESILSSTDFWISVLDAVDMIALLLPLIILIVVGFVVWRNKRKPGGRYDTFPARFCALIFDSILIGGSYELIMFIFYIEETMASFTLIGLIILSYTILLHGYNGQTIGKMIFGVRVLSSSEERLGYFRAFRRDSVLILLFMLQAFTYVLEVDYVEDASGEVQVSEESVENVEEDDTGIIWSQFDLFMILEQVWWVLVFITVIFNKKRRGIHDYIGDSVVVRL